MATLKRFEELEAWQLSRDLTWRIYRLSARPPFSRDFSLRAQVQRAAVSVMANIAEGFESGTSAEFARFLGMAKASAGELESELYVALDLGYLDETELAALHVSTASIKRLIAGLIRYLRRVGDNQGTRRR